MQKQVQITEQMQKQLLIHADHFSGKIAVCSSIAYCTCSKHDTLGVLMVLNKYTHMYYLPGGKRDMAGFGRAVYRKVDESCWDAMTSEFQEEVGVSMSALDISEQNTKSFRCKTPKGSQVKVYYFEVDCSKLPACSFGRLGMFEIEARRWVDLESIAAQILLGDSMDICRSMVISLSRFASLIQKIPKLNANHEDRPERLRVRRQQRSLQLLANVDKSRRELVAKWSKVPDTDRGPQVHQ